LHPDVPVTVVGAGLTGIETAAELVEQGHKVALVCGGQLAPSLSEPGRRSIAKWLKRNGVVVMEDDMVAEVKGDAVVFTDGAVRPSTVTIWTAGFGVPELALKSGLHTDALGRLLVDETLTSVDDDCIVAAGDAAAPSGQPLRMSCQAAGPLGAQAANTVLSRIAGAEPVRLDQRFVGSCISLGRRAGIFQFARPDDTAVNFYFGGGRMGAALKEFICKATVKHLVSEGRKPGSYSWFKGGPRPEQSVFVPEVVTES
jgi:NADH dehydrogenase